jgi:hypothetical protein
MCNTMRCRDLCDYSFPGKPVSECVENMSHLDSCSRRLEAASPREHEPVVVACLRHVHMWACRENLNHRNLDNICCCTYGLVCCLGILPRMSCKSAPATSRSHFFKSRCGASRSINRPGKGYFLRSCVFVMRNCNLHLAGLIIRNGMPSGLVASPWP